MINDDGGSATIDDFTVLLDGDPIPLDEATDGGSGLNHLTVDGPVSLYTFSFSGDCDVDGFFSLTFGDALECDIVADDVPLTQVLSNPLPDALTLIDESLSLALDSFLRDGLRTVEASTAETPPLLQVGVPVTSVPAQPSVTVLVTSGNADLARFNAPAGTRFVDGTAYDVRVLGSNGQAISQFSNPLTLSFLIPGDVDPGSLAAYFFDPAEGRWTPVAGFVAGSRFAVTTSHLSTFALFEFEAGGGVLGKLPSTGISLQAAEGGTLAQFEQQLGRSGVTAVFISYQGRLIGYVFGAPQFVNQEFLSVTGGVIPPGQAMLVVLG